MSEEKIKNNPGSSNDFTPSFIDYCPLPDLKGSTRLGNISTYKNLVNLYISYTLDTSSINLNTGFKLAPCLSGAVKLTKKPDPDKYGYSTYSSYT